MRFASEFWLYMILLLPILWIGLRASDRQAARRLSALLGPEALRHREGHHPRLQPWRRFLSFAGLFWLMLALAQPQWGAREVAVTQRGSDIVIALDISNSMLAEDVPPNRMESAKGELNSFLRRLENSRVGLVFFAGSAFVQCPLTLDYGTAEIFLRMAGPDMMSEQGTNIGAALETSRQLLAKGRGDQERTTFQAILLVTDGEDLEGAWESEAEICAREGIKLIPVGVGDETGGLIPVTDNQGRSAGFMKDEDGSLVMSRLDLASLEKMAGMSGGSTFRIGVDGLAGDRLFAELQRLGQRDLEERRISSYQDRYIWPLLLALGCFLLEMSLFGRPGGLTSRRRHAASLAVLLAAAALAGPDVVLARPSLRPAGAAEADAGRKLYLEGRFEEALALFQDALVRNPEDPKISLAMGETLFQLKRYDEAQAEFQRARDLAESAELQAEAHYNQGTTQLARGDAQKAADELVESLKLDPDQPDALHNLEVALRRLQQQQEQQQQQPDQQDQQDQEDQEKQDQQDQQDQQQQQDQQDQEQDQQQDQQQQQPEDQKQEQQPEESQPEPKNEQLTKEQAEQILKALDRDEEQLKKSVQKRLKGGRPKSGKKW